MTKWYIYEEKFTQRPDRTWDRKVRNFKTMYKTVEEANNALRELYNKKQKACERVSWEFEKYGFNIDDIQVDRFIISKVFPDIWECYKVYSLGCDTTNSWWL